jgi:multidrug efflux pump subunit AcrA (membrane-fusion protein)
LQTPFAELNLPVGASAAVEVISQQALNAVLIPVEALHDGGTGDYFVYVVNQADRKLVQRSIEVGLTDALYAQVISGVQPGELVAID